MEEANKSRRSRCGQSGKLISNHLGPESKKRDAKLLCGNARKEKGLLREREIDINREAGDSTSVPEGGDWLGKKVTKASTDF